MYSKSVKVCLHLVIISQTFLLSYCSLSDVTNELFDAECDGIVSAFGDINADKATDVFLLSKDGKTISILYASIDFDLRRDEVSFSKRLFLEPVNKKITSIVPGDFNSDSQMDVLITWKDLDSGSDDHAVNIEIYSGSGNVLPKNRDPILTLKEKLRDQPIVIDWNGDMIPDLFGELSNGSRVVWVFGKNGSYSLEFLANGTDAKLPPLTIPQTSAFLDLNGDMAADLCAVSNINDKMTFEFWHNQEGHLLWNKSISAPSELKYIGQASYADLNGNHQTNIILPGCLDTECKQPAIFVWSYNKYSREEGKWHQLDVNFKMSDDHHSTFTKSLSDISWLNLPISLKLGDFNLDGLPDALAILDETVDGITNSSTFLLINEECSGNNCDGFSRTFSVDYNQRLHKNKPVIAAFFDIMENGALDVLLSEVSGDEIVVRTIKQDFSADASFLKVLVTSGSCFKDCPNGHKPYGVNQVGPTAKFETTNPEGGGLMGIASQLTQSSYFSLQLPYMLFGLGRTPNFVDQLEVGIPYPSGKSPRMHSWSTIIPNSYVIVLPYPLENPDSWKHELYITPSRLVLLTGVSLLGTCAFIAVIVGLLQWRERNEDKKEKLQEAQRFHFDAM